MLRTTNFKSVYRGTIALLVLAFAMSGLGVHPTQAAPATQVSTGWMPFTGLLYDSQTDSIASLNGLVHVIARWTSLASGGAQVDIDVNLPAASVTVTTDTGVPYTVFGAGQSSILYPTDPLFPTDPLRVVVPSFLIVAVGDDRPLPPSPILPPNPVLPPNPIQPFSFAMQFDLVFSAAGVLDFDHSIVYAISLGDEG